MTSCAIEDRSPNERKKICVSKVPGSYHAFLHRLEENRKDLPSSAPPCHGKTKRDEGNSLFLSSTRSLFLAARYSGMIGLTDRASSSDLLKQTLDLSRTGSYSSPTSRGLASSKTSRYPTVLP